MYGFEQIWINVRSSLWFVPSLLVLGAILLAFSLIQADEVIGHAWLDNWPRLFGAGAEGSRGMLTAIATSMITVAGVTFSITVAALAQASSQYSPLILRNFMRDRANQVVLGVFGGIFVYCLIVLRSIRGGDEITFVPSIAVFAALLAALAGIGFLLYFIHHIATGLEASSILGVVASDALQSIQRLFPDELGAGADETDTERGNEATRRPSVWHPVCPHQTGYIQTIRTDALMSFACEHDAVIRMEKGIGEFAISEAAVASVTFAGAPRQDLIGSITDAFIIGQHRTIDQDAAFGIRQIVDMAVKALSPGINDPTTACSCLNYLGAIMVGLASRRIPAAERYQDGKLRVIALGSSFSDLVGLAFDQIRQNARADAVVFDCMIETLRTVLLQTTNPVRKRILLDQIALVTEHAVATLHQEADRQHIVKRAALARRAGDGRVATSAY